MLRQLPAQPQEESQYFDMTRVPGDILRLIGLFGGAAARKAMAATCSQFRSQLCTTPDNAQRNLHLVNDVADFGHHVGRGHVYEATIMLRDARAKKTKCTPNTLLTSKISLTNSRQRILDEISPLQFAVWSLDRHMFQSITAGMKKSDIAAQINEMFSDNPPAFVKRYGTHVDLTAINQRWADFLAYAKNINWKNFTAGNEQDQQLQTLFQYVVNEQGDLITAR